MSAVGLLLTRIAAAVLVVSAPVLAIAAELPLHRRRRLALIAAVLFSTMSQGCAGSHNAAASEQRVARDAHDGHDAHYPAHWWAPVSPEGAPSWEILPQAAFPGEVILSKRHELGLLSNFAPTPFQYRGKRYASLEGFWQTMKYPEGPDDPRARHADVVWPHTRDEVAQLTAFEAKAAGSAAEANMKRMGITWVTFEGERLEYRTAERGRHYALIVSATREKVRQNPDVESVLLSTGDLILRPDHHQEPNPPPAWRYYDILTEIRTELQRQPAK
ncbi:MAG: hypothetical protein ACKVU1_14235 [bacterium]